MSNESVLSCTLCAFFGHERSRGTVEPQTPTSHLHYLFNIERARNDKQSDMIKFCFSHRHTLHIDFRTHPRPFKMNTIASSSTLVPHTRHSSSNGVNAWARTPWESLAVRTQLFAQTSHTLLLQQNSHPSHIL
jgi:hypothetical protein